MGQHAYIEIDGGSYQCNSTVPDGERPSEYAQECISYHNGEGDCFGKIFIKNVYIRDKGYFAFKAHGESKTESEVFISGCNMGQEIYNPSSQAGNFKVMEWDNIVRKNWVNE